MSLSQIRCVTLSRNQGIFLQSAILSVITQDVSCNYIVYDVGSTDSSREVIADYSDQLSSVLVDFDRGPSEGLNRCLMDNDAPFFYYLNADDLVLPGAFAYVLDYFTSHPDCDVLHGAVQIIDQSGNVTRTMLPMNFSLKGYALGYSVVYQQSTFFRSQCLRDVNFNLDNKTCWDGELIVDLAIAGFKIHKTNTILGQFRIYPESITGSGRFAEQIRVDHARIAHKILGRNLRKSEILFGRLLGKCKAIHRRIFELRRVKRLV